MHEHSFGSLRTLPVLQHLRHDQMQPDRTFQFISDPNYKENLSDRVIAACLNCRQNKIRCSGEASCRQCREKCLVCERSPPRKRPNRVPANSGSGEVLNASTPRDEALPETKGVVGDNLQWPPTLRQADSGSGSYKRELHPLYDSASTAVSLDTDGADTGPGRLTNPLSIQRPHQLIAPVSERAEDEVRPLSNVTQEISPFPFTQTFRGYTSDGIDGSPVTIDPTEWGPVPCQPPITTSTMSLTSRSHAYSTVRSDTMDMFSQGSIASSGYSHSRWRRSPEQLIEAAEAFEERATLLRRLALRSPSHGRNGHRVQQDALLPQQMPQPSNPDLVAFGTLPAIESGVLYEFDLSTILRPDGTLKTGFTPTGGEDRTWDIDMQTSQLFEQPDLHCSLPTPQYDFQQQAHVPSKTSLGEFTHGSLSSASSGGGRRLGRMQRAFHAQLVAGQEADASAARPYQGGQPGTDHLLQGPYAP
ncbi:hypothetical protein LTR56_024719 [Elasticomyces elasticus]|nr:hypothetical protein LTR56_024719 [Elasticomyces elasticus]KAK3619169.1 hypothetical protein LTR22_026081 [Elasticomyces elasticus]KAK4903828.1 hypothetical protein LTR49_026608 [Elasticomyces elasticus]KAK5726554.1 hypothetical protein LTS12_027428 [Elasticomyces elasticus]